MSALLELQSRFSRSLLDNCDVIGSLLSETEKPALAIYRNAYQTRLQETLSNDYPALAELLGVDGFIQLALEYNRAHPSKSYSLRTYGQYMSEFLALSPQYSQLTYLSELAAFEWQLTDIFDIADTSIAVIEDMSNIPIQAWPMLSFKFHSSIRMLDLRWNISEIYPALKSSTKIPDLIRYPHQKHYLIWRQNLSPHYRIMDEHESLAIKTLENNNFSELCLVLSDLSDTPDEASMEAAIYLKSWLAAGLIESINYHE